MKPYGAYGKRPAMSPSTVEHSPTRSWWEEPWFAALIVLLMAVPLVGPDIPPLIDLPGHMGRYRVELDLAHSPNLQRYYYLKWSLLGNLGVDLLVLPLGRLIGLEPAVKLIVAAIPMVTVAGFLWVSHEVHGRVSPTALFAAPLAYGFPFMYGFVNFALSMGFAFLAFGLWLRLARLERLGLRAALFVPISILLWVAHVFGWGTLGLMAFSAELVRQHDRCGRWAISAWRAAIQCLSLGLPFLLMLFWRSGDASGEIGDWFNMDAKLLGLIMALRDRWIVFDISSMGLIALLLLIAWRSPRFAFSRNLAASALALFIIFLVLPRIIFGAGYVETRLAPYMIALAILAVRPKGRSYGRFLSIVAALGAVFVVARMAATAFSLQIYDRAYDRELAALDRLPRGAAVVAFVGTDCSDTWAKARLDHLPSIALVRREALVNDLWTAPGGQVLRVDYPPASGFVDDPSQFVTPARCPHPLWRTIDDALRAFPRNGFDYVWLIDPPAHDRRLLRGFVPIWRSGKSVLFRIERQARETEAEVPAGRGSGDQVPRSQPARR